MRTILTIIAVGLLLAGCRKDEPPKPVAVSPGESRHWDVGDEILKRALPEDVEDGYLEFERTPGFSFGMTLAHRRLSSRNHDVHDMLIYVHRGVARAHVGDKSFTASTGDVIYIPRGAVYSIDSRTEQPLELLTVYHPPFDSDDVTYQNLEELDEAKTNPSKRNEMEQEE